MTREMRSDLSAAAKAAWTKASSVLAFSELGCAKLGGSGLMRVSFQR